MVSLVNSTKEQILLILHKFFQKIKEERTFLNSFYEASITLKPKTKKKKSPKRPVETNKNQKHYIKNYKPVSHMNIDAKILKIFNKPNRLIYKKDNTS